MEKNNWNSYGLMQAVKQGLRLSLDLGERRPSRDLAEGIAAGVAGGAVGGSRVQAGSEGLPPALRPPLSARKARVTMEQCPALPFPPSLRDLLSRCWQEKPELVRVILLNEACTTFLSHTSRLLTPPPLQHTLCTIHRCSGHRSRRSSRSSGRGCF
jgi:hypothetical protein